MLAIVLASKDNTIANPHIYLRRNWVILNKTSFGSDVYKRLKKKYFIYYQINYFLHFI
jgi:hypothetical protein